MRFKFATEVMRTDTGLHADQARWYIGQPRLDLTSRPLLTQHDNAVHIWPTTWNEFLPISMPMTVTALRFWDMACSLSGCLWPAYG